MNKAFLLCLFSSFILLSSSFSQTSGQSVIDKKNTTTGFTREAFTLGNSQIIGRTSAGALSGLTLGSGLTLTGTTLTASASSGVTSITGTANQITVTGTTTPTISLPATITGLTSVTSTTFVGALTGTASGNLVSGGSGDASNFTNIPAANLTGTINTARLPVTITGLTSVTSTTFVGALTGTASGNLALAGGTLTGALTLPNTTFTGLSLTGTQATNTIDVSATWNTTGNPSLIYGRATNTASGATANLLDLGTVAGGSLFRVDKGGAINFSGAAPQTVINTVSNFSKINTGVYASLVLADSTGDYLHFGLSNTGIQMRSGYFLSWSSSATAAGNTADLLIYRDAANILAQRNGTTANTFRVANTWTSGTNNEYGVLDWRTTTNTLRIGSSKGSGGGSNRAVHFIMGDTVEMRLDTDGNVILPALPTTAPATSGAVWRDAAAGNVLKVVP